MSSRKIIGDVLLAFLFILVFAFYIFEMLYPLPYGDILVLTGFILFLLITSISMCSSARGLRSYKSWIFIIVNTFLPFVGIYFLNILFPDGFSASHVNIWAYLLVGFYLFAGYWYLRMDKKDESIMSKISWIGYFLFGLMLIAINVGLYFQEGKSLIYMLLAFIALAALISVFSIRYQRNKKRNHCS